MAKRTCKRFGRGKGGKRVCRSYGKSGFGGVGSKKTRCLKWSKGRTKCLKRAAR